MAELSPLHQRMIEDMTSRNLSLATQRSYVHAAAKFSRYFGRSPESADLVGKFVLVTGAPGAVYCDHFIRMRLPRDVVDPQFTELVGQSSKLRSSIKRLFVTTAGQKTVNQGHIRSLRFPLPSLAEQKRIAAKVVELMAQAALAGRCPSPRRG